MSERWTVAGFHHVQLAMPPGREADAEAFYVGELGFTRIAKPEHLEARGGCWFRYGRTELHLGVEPGFEASTKAHPALIVHGLAALRAALEEAQCAVADDTHLDGHERCYVRDPFGNRIELIEEVGA